MNKNREPGLAKKIKAPSLAQRVEYLEKKIKEPKESKKSKFPDWFNEWMEK